MVRTRADVGAIKVSAAKAPRKVLGTARNGASSSSSPSGKSSSKDRYVGGNSYNPQPIPEWQKGINSFFKVVDKPETGEASSSSVEETPESSLTTGECSNRTFPEPEEATGSNSVEETPESSRTTEDSE